MNFLGVHTSRPLPRPFWVLFWGRLVNMVGASMVFPFLTLYLHHRLHADLTVVGMVMLAMGATQVVATSVGGSLSDRWGRRRVMMLSLGGAALATLAVGLARSPSLLVAALAAQGLIQPLSMPASMAMITDLVPREDLMTAYSLSRVASNAGIVIGPMLGSLVVGHSYLGLFIGNAVGLMTLAVLTALALPETRPDTAGQPAAGGPLTRLAGDGLYWRFLAIWAGIGLVYAQLYLTLPVYMHLDLHLPTASFGILAAENALVVVTTQVLVGSWLSRYNQLAVVGVGTAIYGLGFATFLASARLGGLAGSVAFITMGEDFVNPAAMAFVGMRAPADMRGRYLGWQSVANRVGGAVAPLVGGLLLDRGGGPALWLGTALLATLLAIASWRLGRSALGAAATGQTA